VRLRRNPITGIAACRARAVSDDRPPLLDLGLLVGGERLRGLSLARRNLEALFDEFL
jgi:hypothetical protein